MGDGALRCSLSLSPNVLPDSPVYSSRQVMCGNLWLYMTLLFLKFVAPVLGGYEECFDGVTPFEMHLYCQVVACPFEPFPKTVDVWYYYGDVFAI